MKPEDVSPQPGLPDEAPAQSPAPGPVHRSVMPAEVLEWLAPREGSILVDGTAGAGGHTSLLAQRVGPSGRVIGLDRDPEMLAFARAATEGLPVTLMHASYRETRGVLDELGFDGIDGIVLDLGLSSDQLAWDQRGFSFNRDGPLDMRFDPAIEDSAADLVNGLPEAELADIFYHFGEERHSRRVARRIVETRKTEKITTTGRLAEIVRRSIPGKWGQIDPATRVFQALRIAVNDELGQLDSILADLPRILKPEGRAVIISFHSLEDRRVKHAFRDNPELTVLTKKPIEADEREVAENPRSRSAKLRAAQRCPDPTGTPSTGTNTGRSKKWSRTTR